MKQQESVFTGQDTDDAKLGRFVAGSSVAILSSLLAGVFALAWAWLMTMLLGQKDYSILGPYLPLFWVLTVVTSFGLPATMITFISHHYETDFEAARRMAVEGNQILAILSAIFSIIALAFIVVLALMGRLHGLYLALCLIMLVAVVARQMYLGVYACMAGLQRMDCVALANVVFSVMLPISSLTYILLANHFYSGETLRHLRIAAGAAGIATSAVIAYPASVLVLRKTKLRPRLVYSTKITTAHWKEMFTFGWVTNAALIGHTVLGQMPPIYLSYFMAQWFGWFGPTMAENQAKGGIFSAAFTYALAPSLIIGLTFAVVPAMSEAERQGNHALMNRYFNSAIKYCFALLALITAIYAACAGSFVDFFTSGKFPAAQMQSITLLYEISISASSLLFLFLNMLVGLKRPAIAAKTIGVVLILEIISMTIAGKFTGSINAVAVAIIISFSIGLLYLLKYLISVVGLKLDLKILLGPTVAAVAGWAAGAAVMTHGRLGFVIPFAVIPACFFIVDGLLGGIEKEDLDILRQTLISVKAGFLVFIVDIIEKAFSLSPLFKRNTGETNIND